MRSNIEAILGARLREASDGMWGALVDPRDAVWDDEGRWWNVGVDGGATRAGGVWCATEAELDTIRGECRWLAATNEFAINGHENRVSYVVGAGHTYRVTAKKEREADPQLERDAQDAIDEFLRRTRWHARQQEIVRRRDRDGEVFLRFFVGPGGTTELRFVEPGQVRTPAEHAGAPGANWGIACDGDDVERVLGYFVNGELVDAGEIQHRKANVDRNVKRGCPLFFPVRKNLRRAEKLLRNMSVVAEIQAAIALIRRHPTGSRTAVQQFVSDGADGVRREPGGRESSVRRYGPGTILDVSAGTEYDFPAARLNAANYIRVLQAELRAIASRLVMPEFMLSADASNANYASTMVAESPAVRMFERMQAEMMFDDVDVLWRVLGNRVAAGRLRREALEVLEIQAAAPSLAVRNAFEEERVLELQHASGVLSPQTWAMRRGLDYDQEQRNWELHRERRAARDKVLEIERS